MKVHLNQIPDDGLHLEGVEPNTILDLHEQGIHPLGDVRYALDMGVSEGGLFATGTIGVDLDLQCVKCLEQFRYPLDVDEFAVQLELTNSETVDLTEYMREDILLALPPHPHCDWNGQRVCKGDERLKQFEATAEPLPNEREVWGALDQLKIKKT